MDITRIRGKEMIGKIIVGEAGRKYGVVGDIDFITESGELLNIIVSKPTKHLEELNLKKDEQGRILIPFTAVKSVGDFVIISETDLI